MNGHRFTFVDLFAGIGGTRKAFEEIGGKCLFTSEKDPCARLVYRDNFGNGAIDEDITQINPSDIPDHDILVAGFPCQPFSMAGNRNGFNETSDNKGPMFYYIRNIVQTKRPKAFFLENVKGIMSICGGETIQTILHILRNQMDYYVPDPQVINSLDFGLPQNRERVFIVGFRKDICTSGFTFPEPWILSEVQKSHLNIGSILEDYGDMPIRDKIPKKYYLSEGYLRCLEEHKVNQKRQGRGFGYSIRSFSDVANTLMVGGMGRERNLVIDPKIDMNSKNTTKRTPINSRFVRTLTPREFARLQGFPDDFRINVSDVNAYRLFGNSVSIPAVRATAEKMLEKMV